MNCYFRTNISKNSGSGNYMRCLRLAKSLQEVGHHCTIFTDKFSKKRETYIEKIKHINLYISNKLNLKNNLDAKIFLQATLEPGFVFVDDYRIGIEWQKKIKKVHKKLILINDYTKKNVADIIINTKPDFLTEAKYNSQILNNKQAKILLGPKYAIIDKKVKKKKKTNNKFKILFFFGASSDLKISVKIIKKFLSQKNVNKFEFYVAVSDNSKNTKYLLNFQKKNKRKVKLIYAQKKLSSKLNNFDFFIGSAGITIFETALYKIPSLLFITADNQKVDLEALEKLGHYFLLDKEDLKETNKIVRMIIIFYRNMHRLKNLINSRSYSVDDLGIKRILGEIFKQKISQSSSKIRKKILQKVGKHFSYTKIDDEYINRYFDVRNKIINRQYSINKKKLKKIDHYAWWFSNQRKSFIFKKGSKEIAFFFHDFIEGDKNKYLIPGWYLLNKQTSFLDVITGIKEQYRTLRTLKKKKNIIQLGIIHKKNKSMIDLAPKLNWIKLKPEDNIKRDLKKKLRFSNKFNYFKR